MNLAERIAVTRGRATGFDYMRIILAALIVVHHTTAVCYGGPTADDVFKGPCRFLIAAILPLFFALSGFLVAGSLDRTPEVVKFLGLRFIRIFPALVTETILSALVLGPLVTTLPLGRYFLDRKFDAYMLNMLGIPHYQLPGVFTTNPFPNIVNQQLWTVPYELRCYILLAVLAFLGLALHRKMVVWICLGVQVIVFAIAVHNAHGHFGIRHSPVAGNVLVGTFLSGVVLYALRDKVEWSFTIFVASAVATLVLLAVPLGDYLVPYPTAYVTIYLGLCNPKAKMLHRLGDLSYGIFLYGFPIQQLVASWGGWTHHWFVNLPISLVMTTAFAFMSWNIIEKPALRLKSRLVILQPIDSAIEQLKGFSRNSLKRLTVAYKSREGPRGFVDRTP